jgi:hypothetical protein
MLKDQVTGKNGSWAIRWRASAFLQDKLSLYPNRSLVKNIGHDGSGVHCGPSMVYDVKLADRPILVQPISINEDKWISRAREEYYQPLKRKPFFVRVINKLYKLSKRIGLSIENK